MMCSLSILDPRMVRARKRRGAEFAWCGFFRRNATTAGRKIWPRDSLEEKSWFFYPKTISLQVAIGSQLSSHTSRTTFTRSRGIASARPTATTGGLQGAFFIPEKRGDGFANTGSASLAAILLSVEMFFSDYRSERFL